MRKHLLRTNSFKLICALFLSGLSVKSNAQTDVDFWFAAPEVSTSNQTFDLPIVIRMTTGTAAATVTISQPAGGGMPNQVVNIPANSTQSVDLSTWLNVIESQPANTTLNYGLHIVATAPITAYYEVVSLACLCNPEIFVLKGSNSLGTSFWIPSQNFLDNSQSYNPAPRSAFDIVATQNGTVVTITPSNDIVGHLAGVPFNINLNAGQVYSATAVNWQAALHLQGSRVTSNLPIAITMKDDLLAGSPYGGCADLAGDQIVPVNIIGSNYIAMNGALNAPEDQIFVTATQNGTNVSKDGVLLTTINAGQTYQIPMTNPSSYIQTSNPAYCYQLSGIGCEVGSAVLPQIDCSGSTSVSFNRSSPNDLYINVMVQNGGQGNFLVNGAPGVVTAGQFAAVPGTAGVWYAAQVYLPVGQYAQGTVITVNNTTHSFHLGVLDGSVASGARFGYFSNYGGVPSEATTTTYELCAGDDIYLFADSTDGAVYSWAGPNSWTSTDQDPVIVSATTAMTGIYSLTVTANGCVSPVDTVNITVHPIPTPPTVNYKPAYCTNEPFIPFNINGQNIIYYDSATGGTPTTTAPVVPVTVPGVYNYWVTQTVNGCESSRFPLTVTVYPEVNADFTFVLDHGCEEDTVFFTSTSTGHTRYEWNFGDGSAIDTNANPTHIYQTQGIYNVRLYVANENCFDTIVYLIDLNHPLTAAFTTDVDTICQHSSITFTDASTYTTFNSIVPTYSWNFADGTPLETTQNPIHTFHNTGIYDVWMTITDFVPCSATAHRIVYVDSLSAVSISISDSVICKGEGITFLGRYSDIGLRSITWDFGDGIISYDINPAHHSFEYPGNYLVKLTTDYRVCRDTTVEVLIPVKPTPIINLGPDTSMCPTAGPIVIQDLINGGNALASWRWIYGDATMAETSFNIAANAPGRYASVVTIDGCSATDSVTVVKDCYIDVPNVFTPNGDNMNDYFLPRQWLSKGVTSFKMIIYNRWGQEIYSTTNIDGRGWDGKFNGVDQPQGVFVYTIDVKFKDGTGEKKQGNVTLLR
jgi:gliding motility-associated-like protein